jgi:hypothetical protein
MPDTEPGGRCLSLGVFSAGTELGTTTAGSCLQAGRPDRFVLASERVVVFRGEGRDAFNSEAW